MKKPINSRSKGKTGELELSGIIADRLGVKLTRNLAQSRAGGHDLECVTNDTAMSAFFAMLAIEVKRSKTTTPAQRDSWWQQATDQAARAGRVPLLAYRKDREGWRIQLPLRFVSGREWHDTGPCELSLDDFVTFAQNTAKGA